MSKTIDAVLVGCGGISRTWLIAHRGAMDDDPLVYTLRDRLSRLVILATVLVMVVAALP